MRVELHFERLELSLGEAGFQLRRPDAALLVARVILHRVVDQQDDAVQQDAVIQADHDGAQPTGQIVHAAIRG